MTDDRRRLLSALLLGLELALLLLLLDSGEAVVIYQNF